MNTLIACLMLISSRAAAAAPATVEAPEASTITATGEILYPPPPDKARIRFVRSLRTKNDLKGKKSGAFGKFMSAVAGGDADLPLLHTPYGVWKQGDRLYVTDTVSPAVMVFDLKKGELSNIGGTRGKGRIISPIGITADAGGNAYVSDSGDHSVKAYAPDGALLWQTTELGEKGGKFNRPSSIAFTPNGDLLVLDTGNKRAVLLTKEGKFIREMCRNKVDPFALGTPTNVWIEKNGDFIVTDPLMARVHVFNSTGGYVSGFGEQGDSAGYLTRPRGVATDSGGNIYVADAIFNRVQIFDRQGQLLLYFASPGQGPAELSLPAGMFIDADDFIYVADSKNQRIQVFQHIKYPDDPPANLPPTAPGDGK